MLLQIILSISVVTITAFLVMLLIQARHTAASVQRFADSATQDLHLVAKDVHELRMRADEVTQLALATPKTFTLSCGPRRCGEVT